jgi:hypothetical protein
VDFVARDWRKWFSFTATAEPEQWWQFTLPCDGLIEVELKEEQKQMTSIHIIRISHKRSLHTDYNTTLIVSVFFLWFILLYIYNLLLWFIRTHCPLITLCCAMVVKYRFHWRIHTYLRTFIHVLFLSFFCFYESPLCLCSSAIAMKVFRRINRTVPHLFY